MMIFKNCSWLLKRELLFSKVIMYSIFYGCQEFGKIQIFNFLNEFKKIESL